MPAQQVDIRYPKRQKNYLTIKIQMASGLSQSKLIFLKKMQYE
jgi:hypothetical protein